MVRIWEQALFDSSCLDQLGLRLIFRGVPSDAGGPDYQDAVLAMDGRELVRGDVEFHVRSSDWYRHAHHRQRRYNNVVLHVVWERDEPVTTREDGATVPVLALAHSTSPHLPAGAHQPPLLHHPCNASLRALPPESIVEAVHAAAHARFASRAERFAADVELSGPDQSAYAALLEAMGYASNRDTFRALAEAVPYGWVMTVPSRHRTPVLLAAAGFGDSPDIEPPCRLSPDSWRLSRLRPGNHPAVRLSAVGALLSRFPRGLGRSWTDSVLSATRASDIGKLLRISIEGEHVLGKGRADEIAVSVVLPFVAALEPGRSEPRDLFLNHPSPPQTRWTRTMTALLREAGHEVPVKRAPDHQGLHALYLDHCRYARPAGCPVCGSRPRRNER